MLELNGIANALVEIDMGLQDGKIDPVLADTLNTQLHRLAAYIRACEKAQRLGEALPKWHEKEKYEECG